MDANTTPWAQPFGARQSRGAAAQCASFRAMHASSGRNGDPARRTAPTHQPARRRGGLSPAVTSRLFACDIRATGAAGLWKPHPSSEAVRTPRRYDVLFPGLILLDPPLAELLHQLIELREVDLRQV